MPRMLLCAAALGSLWLGVAPDARAQAPEPPAGSSLTDQQREVFLREAKVVKRQAISTGVTGTVRLTLSDGALTHDAHFQSIDQTRTQFQSDRGTEINFRDCYKFNIAAYKLDRLIGLNVIPVSVERSVAGKTGAVTWWLDDVLMMEKERIARKISPPDPARWNDQMNQIRVFNELVYNTDPNMGNLLICRDWRLCMVDYTRAFRLHHTLREKKNLVRIDRRVYDGLKALDGEALMRELRPHLTKTEIQGVLARRDAILKHFDEEIARRGEAAVICSLPGH